MDKIEKTHPGFESPECAVTVEVFFTLLYRDQPDMYQQQFGPLFGTMRINDFPA